MPHVYVCPLSRIAETVAGANASHLVSLINDDTPVIRPGTIPEENHLFLGINDIVEPMDGMVLPAAEHVETLIDFVSGWHPVRPIVVHCYAGISRSTAAAYITLCALKPDRDEADIARRMRAASRFAYPNPRLVAIGDEILGRNGRMVAAVKAIGRGEIVAENIPFSLGLEE
ncbi:MAG TPA: tyrosine phosphatase family protein [Bauldia sp.]|nr:tyrosine phosphatase family protein [Bauldia sp.]